MGVVGSHGSSQIFALSAEHTLKSPGACLQRNSSSGSRKACSSGDTHNGLCVFHATFWHALQVGAMVQSHMK